MSGASVSLREIGFTYRPPATRVVSDISFDVHQREIVGLTGASGTGKSTILRLIAGTIVPNEGSVQRSRADSHPIAYSPQGDVLLEYRTAFENAALLLERSYTSSPDDNERLQDIEKMLDRLRFASKREDLPTSLSGGMRQRVQFIQALATRAPVILFDEPFAQQDRDNQRAMEKMLVSTVREHDCAAVLVSHDIDALAAVCDRTLFLAGAPAGVHGSIETPPSLRSLDADARRADPTFASHNDRLWAQRAKGALL